MTSLPPQIPEFRQSNPRAVRAYQLCLELERSLENAGNNNDANIPMDLIYTRILGSLIHFAPTDMALETVVDEIVSARSNNTLLEIGKMYYRDYVRAFRANKVRTPASSRDGFKPCFFDTEADMITDTWNDTHPSHTTAKNKALIRDGHRCVVTGAYNTNSVITIRELKMKIPDIPNVKLQVTQCAHIFSESTNMEIESSGNKREYSAAMWVVLKRLGYANLIDELNGANVHRLENVMTLDGSFRVYFDQLWIWFIVTEVKDKYKLDAIDPIFLSDCPEYVTFTTPDPALYPLPSPEYLAIHAACAQVAHLSGAGPCIDKFYEEMEERTTLDPHGASAALLEHAILELQATSSRHSIDT